jgi:hypothetical protein
VKEFYASLTGDFGRRGTIGSRLSALRLKLKWAAYIATYSFPFQLQLISCTALPFNRSSICILYPGDTSCSCIQCSLVLSVSWDPERVPTAHQLSRVWLEASLDPRLPIVHHQDNYNGLSAPAFCERSFKVQIIFTSHSTCAWPISRREFDVRCGC